MLIGYLVLILGWARGVEVETNETIDAPGDFTPTLAEGNATVFQSWLELCQSDPTCAAAYDLEETQDLESFIHLIQVVDPFPGDPVFLENALVYEIYGKTPEQIEDTILVLQMVVNMLNSTIVCGVNEKHKIEDGTVTCEPLPGRSPSDRNVEDVILKILIAAGSVLLLVYVIKTGYSFSQESWDASVRAFIKMAPPLRGGTVPGVIPSASLASVSEAAVVAGGRQPPPTYTHATARRRTNERDEKIWG